MILCHCNRLTDSAVRKAVYAARGDVTVALTELGFSRDCGACTEQIEAIASEVRESLNQVTYCLIADSNTAGNTTVRALQDIPGPCAAQLK